MWSIPLSSKDYDSDFDLTITYELRNFSSESIQSEFSYKSSYLIAQTRTIFINNGGTYHIMHTLTLAVISHSQLELTNSQYKFLVHY